LNHHQQLAKSEASFDARTMINGLRSRKAYKDLAQGFNPGLGVFNAICPVWAPGTPFEGWSWKHAQSRGKQTWRPFRACRVNCGNPGLKPWAHSCFPFGEHKARCQTPNANSSDDVSAIAPMEPALSNPQCVFSARRESGMRVKEERGACDA